jgi:signal transduction histidine kinase/ActR/RegA family two-component response regulator
MDLSRVFDLRLHGMDDQALERSVRRFNREREARIAAEELLEQKGRELYKANTRLQDLLENLDEKVRQRTEELRIALAEAQRANRVKTDFLAMISHEIRTPMNAVHGVAQILKNEDLPDNQIKLVDLMLQSSTSLLAIVNDLLDLSKIDAGKMKLEIVYFSVAQLSQDIKELFSAKAKKKNLDLIIEQTVESEIVVAGDPGRLRQILINLIDNALKYTVSGSVTLGISVFDIDPDTKSFCFTVVDTGPGIPEDKLDRLFSRFDRIDIKSSHNIEGAGLGLALCKQLAELLNGKIGCDTAVGRGSSFWMTVPFKVAGNAPKKIEEPQRQTVEPKTMTRALRILVAEDNIANQVIVRVMLEKLGHLVDIAADGNEAVAAVKLLDYDVVFMDMQMPNLGGMDATEQIRALPHRNNNVPIYALTANAMDSDRVRCLDAGMTGFLSKPVSRLDLIATLNELDIG